MVILKCWSTHVLLTREVCALQGSVHLSFRVTLFPPLYTFEIKLSLEFLWRLQLMPQASLLIVGCPGLKPPGKRGHS